MLITRLRYSSKILAIFLTIFLFFGSGNVPFVVNTVFAAIQAEIYVAPNGNDVTGNGTINNPYATIAKARDVVRTIKSGGMTGDIIVYLRGGTYTQTGSLQFNENDSGTAPYTVIFKAYTGETPIISGGKNITGWTQVAGQNFWQASVGTTDNFRQIYVSGERAQRARSDLKVTGTGWHAGGYSSRDGIIIDENISLGTNVKVKDLTTNLNYIELHWIVQWNDMRYPVDNITNGDLPGQKVFYMRQPYYSWGVVKGDPPNYTPSPTYGDPFYVENAYELMDQPGEWYLNRVTNILYYYPRSGEDMTTAEVYVPMVERVMEIKGSTLTNKVHNIQFEGLTFRYGTWLRTSDKGQDAWGAEELLNGPATQVPINTVLVGSNIYLEAAEYIVFEKDRIERMGGAALGLINGVNNVTVRGCVLNDISDAAILVGHFDHDYIGPGEEVCKNNLISNNYITKAGQEYNGSPAINAFYVDGLEASHNEISDVPYSGMNFGWDLAEEPNSTTCRNNKILYNRVHDVMKIPYDGGGIYTQAKQPNSICQENFVYDQHQYAAPLYLDAGTDGYTFSNNVVDLSTDAQGVPPGLETTIWYMANIYEGLPNTIGFNNITNNYTTDPNNWNRNPARCVETGTTVVSTADWTGTALNIVNNSGIQSAYRSIIPGAKVDFQDRPNISKALTGTYQDINWGTQDWMTTSYTGYTKYLYSNSTSTTEITRTFTLPAGKVLKSLKLAGQPTSTVKISQTGNSEIVWNNISAATPTPTPQPYVTSKTLYTIRNNFSGWVGMKITVGASPITVKSLGRIFVSGNTGTHTVKIVNAGTGVDVPGASVSVSGGTAGQFKYVDLASPVTLQASTAYYIASQETNGGDQWYDTDTSITTTSVATCNDAAYYDTAWHTVGMGTNKTFVPVDFKYSGVNYQTYTTGWTSATDDIVTIKLTCTFPGGASNIAIDDIVYGEASGGGTPTPTPTPVATATPTPTPVATATPTPTPTPTPIPTPTPQPYVTSKTLYTIRSDFSGWVGMKITVGASPITVKSLGRIFVSGNTGTHTVKIVNAGTGVDVPGASVSVSGGTAGQFKYVDLASPVTLQASTAYYIASQETNGGDQWYDTDTSITTTSVATCNDAAYYDTAWHTVGMGTNKTFVPVDFKY